MEQQCTNSQPVMPAMAKPVDTRALIAAVRMLLNSAPDNDQLTPLENYKRVLFDAQGLIYLYQIHNGSSNNETVIRNQMCLEGLYHFLDELKNILPDNCEI